MASASAGAKRGERLDARLTREEKELIETAASLRGTSSSDFVRMAINEAALSTIGDYEQRNCARISGPVALDATAEGGRPLHKVGLGQLSGARQPNEPSKDLDFTLRNVA